MIEPIRWEADRLILLDQTLLPNKVEYFSANTIQDVRNAIKTMQVRGAPAIGVAAAYGLYLGIRDIIAEGHDEYMMCLRDKCSYLASARPTAVNLSWALGRLSAKVENMRDSSCYEKAAALLDEAILIHTEDGIINRRIGENLLTLLRDGMGILTHCNAGALATTRLGTALSPIYLAKQMGWNLKVYADETRPRLQGSILTAFELCHSGIDVTVITDSMAAVVMSQRKIDAVIVGCDRIAANGDTANKIGTLGLSIIAKNYKVPFYIAAPTPTIDLKTPSGEYIPVEERDPEEITCSYGQRTTPAAAKVFNPSFDVTPHQNITAIVTEKAIMYPPFTEKLSNIH